MCRGPRVSGFSLELNGQPLLILTEGRLGDTGDNEIAVDDLPILFHSRTGGGWVINDVGYASDAGNVFVLGSDGSGETWVKQVTLRLSGRRARRMVNDCKDAGNLESLLKSH